MATPGNAAARSLAVDVPGPAGGDATRIAEIVFAAEDQPGSGSAGSGSALDSSSSTEAVWAAR